MKDAQTNIVCEVGRWVVALRFWLVTGSATEVVIESGTNIKVLSMLGVSFASLCKRLVFTNEGNTEFILRTGHSFRC